jgi:phage virion morphogenesis protein
MGIQIKDEISPSLAKLAAGLKDRRPILQAMGLALQSITQRAFRDAALRPAPWAPKKDGSAATLIKTTTLMRSIRVVEVTNDSVTVGSDRRYAAIHQLGGVIRPRGKALVFSLGGKKIFARKVVIPPRPFFPVTPTGEMTEAARAKIEAVARAKIAALLPR